VIDPVEELLQVHVHNEATTFLHVGLRTPHGVVRRPPGPEPVARLREAGVEPRLQHLQQELLDEAVEHRRDAEHSLAAAGLRNRDPPHQPGPVAPGEELLAQARPVGLQVDRQLLDRHPVDAG